MKGRHAVSDKHSLIAQIKEKQADLLKTEALAARLQGEIKELHKQLRKIAMFAEADLGGYK